jgi:hypothetical protein
VLVTVALPAFVRGQPQPPAVVEAQQVGTVSGTVLDKSSGDPIIEAGVEVVGQGKTVRTDLDGKFSVKLPPGTYELRIFAPLYQGTRLTKVAVRGGQVSKADVALAPAGAAGVEVVEVVAQAKKAAEATQLLKRQKSAVVSDNVSGEAIAKSPDSDAAEVVQRVPSVTVKDDKFIVVRGLGERYSSALLNGNRLPSTDPLKRVVPLDLFPAEFIESLSIVKSYTPDLPGDFSGGLAELELREFPDTLQANVGLSTGGNTATTFRRFRTYDGSDLDYFGFGGDFRALPDDYPIDGPLAPPPRQTLAAARRLKNIWDVESTTAPPNSGINMSFGNSWGPFGLALGGVYTTEYKTRRNEVSRSYTNQTGGDDPTVIVPQDSFLYDTSTFETRLGGILTTAYKLTDDHKFNFRALINRNSYDDVREGRGFATQFNTNQVTQQLRYTEEELDFGQLAGEHRLFPWLEVDWRSAYARTTQDTPDTRNLTFDVGTPENPHPPQFQNDAIGGYRVFGALEERLTDSAVDFTVPFKTRLPATDFWSDLPAKLKFGPAYTYRDRTHDLRFLRYQCSTCTTEDRELPPEVLLDPDNLGPGQPVDVLDTTQQRDQFAATQEIAGAYGLLDLPLVRDRLRLIGGARVEYSLIRLDTADDQGDRVNIRKKDTDVLPGVNLVYSARSDMNVRVGWSKTVSRPEFRELSPVLFPEPRTFRSLVGNPDLVETKIDNYDARWEWFFAPGELVSFGLFYKKLDKPIEIGVAPLGSDLVDRFRNAEDGELKGLEFEGRKNFGFVHHRLAYLSLQTNVAYIESEVKVPREGTDQQTSTKRELQGQSPFVVNAAAEYAHPELGTARLLYNTAGRRIVSAGASGLPDFFEERRDSLDAVLIVPLKPYLGVSLTSKFAVENILNDTNLVTLGGNTQRRFLTGTKFSFGLSYSY